MELFQKKHNIPANHSFLKGVTPFSEFLNYKKGVNLFFFFFLNLFC